MTSTDVALNEHAHRDMTIPTPTSMDDPTGGRLIAWAEGLAAAHRIASALCMTSFAPAHFRGKPEEAAAAILYGDELGFTPTQALQNIFMIGGKPGMYARQMAALVMSHGHQVWTVEKTDTSVTVAGLRRGSSSPDPDLETWTIERARKAGYTSNKKYDTDPQAMLYARALADVCRRIAPDVLAGIAYTVEELEVIPSQVIDRTRVGGTAALRARMETARPGSNGDAAPPAFDPTRDAPAPSPEGPTAADAETGEAITDEQRRAIFAAFRDAGFTTDARTDEGRKPRLDYMSQILNEPVNSTNDLTTRQASIILDALREDALALASEPSETP